MERTKKEHAYRTSIASSYGSSGYPEHLPEHVADRLGSRSHAKMRLAQWYRAFSDTHKQSIVT